MPSVYDVRQYAELVEKLALYQAAEDQGVRLTPLLAQYRQEARELALALAKVIYRPDLDPGNPPEDVLAGDVEVRVLAMSPPPPPPDPGLPF